MPNASGARHQRGGERIGAAVPKTKETRGAVDGVFMRILVWMRCRWTSHYCSARRSSAPIGMSIDI